jgi:hypothetical protein
VAVVILVAEVRAAVGNADLRRLSDTD